MHKPAALHQVLRTAWRTRALLCVLVRLAPVLLAAFGASTAQAVFGPALACSPALDSSTSLWAVADFDGDNSIDLARVRVSQTGGGVAPTAVDVFAFCEKSAPPSLNWYPRIGLVLSARDIDADTDQDLVLRDPFAGVALGVWLNDGKGGFAQTEPSAFPGAGDDPFRVARSAPRAHRPATSLPSRSYEFVARSAGPAQLQPGIPRRSPENLTAVAAGWRDAGKSRAPPILSY